MQVEIEPDLVARLRHEAAVRDLPVKSLICRLLDVIARDRLVAAVLDDAD